MSAVDDLPVGFEEWLAGQDGAPELEAMNANVLDIWINRWREDTYAGPSDVELYGAGVR